MDELITHTIEQTSERNIYYWNDKRMIITKLRYVNQNNYKLHSLIYSQLSFIKRKIIRVNVS